MRVINKIKEFFKKLKLRKRAVTTEISPSSLKNSEELMHLQKALAYERGKRIKAEKIIEELTRSEESKEDIARELALQREELLEKDIGTATSIKRLLKYAKKKKKAIHIVSYNHERDYGIFRDLGISSNGLFSVYVYGVKRPIISGKNLSDIFRNCAGLANDAKKGMIAINLDEEGRPVENIEQVEVPEIVIDFNGKINVMNHDLRPFIERIVEKDTIISEQLNELRINEMTISELTKEINEEKKKNEILKTENESYKASLSDTLERMKDIQRNYNNLIKNMTILQEDNEMYEEFKEKMLKAIEDLHEKLGDEAGKTNVEKALDKLRNIIDWYEQIKPEVQVVTVPQKEEKEEKLPQPVKT